MAGIEAKSFDSPDETRQFQAHGHAEVVELDGKTVLRSVFEPGWHWKDDVGPIAGTDTCQTHHFGYMVSGQMKVVMDDGTELTMKPGELIEIQPGHDAEVVGDQEVVFIDFGDVSRYAKSG
jgi:mannose-6-phosphate isomerase-like protein (cupin superfamily)